MDAIRGRVTRPLRGLRVAPYLGCLVTRPDSGERWREKEHPRAFDQMLEALEVTIRDAAGGGGRGRRQHC